jgi:alpha-glucosidase
MANEKFLWWRDGVIYQIYPRSFADSNGDSVGDLPGITSKLDYLQWLGVDAIWLSPINPSPMVDFGYDVANYHDIDPIFGTLGDFDRLVSEAHARGIHIVMDMVMNHTSDQHEWFIESRSSRDNPKRDWYIWRDPKNGREPNNWESVFGGKAWKFDSQTGQYYLHLFTVEQPDLNWSNPQVKETMFNECAFWLDRGVDGFRLDVAHMLIKTEGLPDNPTKRFRWRAYDRQDHGHHINHPRTHSIWKEFREVLNRYPERMAVGEVEATDAEKYYGTKHDELQLVFNFDLLHQKWTARGFAQVIHDWETKLAREDWPCWTLNNHDNPRSITRYASSRVTDARAKVAATMLLTLRGTPFLYYGEELGMRDGKIPRNEILDPPGKKYWPIYKGRDGCRTPMVWNDSTNAGFSTGKPWLRVNPDFKTINVEAERSDPNSMLNYYQRLIELRRSSPALRSGLYRSISNSIDLWAYEREAYGQRLLIALNFFSQPARLKIVGDWKIYLSSVERSDSIVHGELALAPNEAVILEAKPA